MASAMVAASRAGGTSWTRRMWAPLRMAVVLAAVVVLETHVSESRHGAPGFVAGEFFRKDLRDRPARMGSWRVWSWWRWARRVKFASPILPKPKPGSMTI